MKMQSFCGVFEKQFFHKYSLKNFLIIFLQNVSLFFMCDFCFSFFDFFRRMDFCLGWLIVFSMSPMLNNEMYSFFFIFSIWFFTFKNQELVFFTVFFTFWPYCSHSILYHFNFVLAPSFILEILIFSVAKELNDFRVFFDVRPFF